MLFLRHCTMRFAVDSQLTRKRSPLQVFPCKPSKLFPSIFHENTSEWLYLSLLTLLTGVLLHNFFNRMRMTERFSEVFTNLLDFTDLFPIFQTLPICTFPLPSGFLGQRKGALGTNGLRRNFHVQIQCQLKIIEI